MTKINVYCNQENEESVARDFAYYYNSKGYDVAVGKSVYLNENSNEDAILINPIQNSPCDIEVKIEKSNLKQYTAEEKRNLKLLYNKKQR